MIWDLEALGTNTSVRNVLLEVFIVYRYISVFIPLLFMYCNLCHSHEAMASNVNTAEPELFMTYPPCEEASWRSS
jgi:hypothetical protein